MLDAMVQLMTGSHDAFDPAYLADLETCMQLIDPALPEIQVQASNYPHFRAITPVLFTFTGSVVSICE